jgi:hypothetical protein
VTQVSEVDEETLKALADELFSSAQLYSAASSLSATSFVRHSEDDEGRSLGRVARTT